MKKLILNFNSKDSKKIRNPKNFLGGKGANLSEMGKMGLPVPPGFTISTKVCEIFYKDKKKLNQNLINQIKKELQILEKYFPNSKIFLNKFFSKSVLKIPGSVVFDNSIFSFFNSPSKMFEARL